MMTAVRQKDDFTDEEIEIFQEEADVFFAFGWTCMEVEVWRIMSTWLEQVTSLIICTSGVTYIATANRDDNQWTIYLSTFF